MTKRYWRSDIDYAERKKIVWRKLRAEGFNVKQKDAIALAKFLGRYPSDLRIDPKSIAGLARASGLKEVTVRSRINKLGWTKEDAISIRPRPRDCITPDIARANGLNPETIRQRLNKGWTREQALTTPSQKYNSVEQQALNAGVPPSTVRYRLKKGLTLKQALMTPKDSLRIRPNSIQQLALAAGINRCTVRDRIKSGWSLKRALSTPPIKQESNHAKNHHRNIRNRNNIHASPGA